MHKTVRTIEITAKKKVLDYFSGMYHSVFKGQGLDIDDLREYQPGDDIKAIAWAKSAQMSRPFVKSFTEERDANVLFLVDISKSLDFGSQAISKRAYVASLAAIIAFAAMANRDKVGALFFASKVEHQIPLRRGDRHGVRVISEILEYQSQTAGDHTAGSSTNIEEALIQANKLFRKRAILFLLSDFIPSVHLSQAVAVTAKKNDLICIRVLDPREKRLAHRGCLRFVDMETNEVRCIHNTSSMMHQYEKQREEELVALTQLIQRCDGSLLDVDTTQEAYIALRNFFIQRKKRLYRC